MSTPRELPAGVRRVIFAPWFAPLLVFLGCLATAIWMTWPMAKDPSYNFYGGVGDPIGSLAMLREMVEDNQPPFLPGSLHDFSAPEGYTIAWIRGLASVPVTGLLYVLGEIFGPVAAYNLFALAAFPLTGLATFLLARKLSGNGWASAIAAFAFAFQPYAVVKGHGHYELAHGWVIVLSVWRTLEAIERPSVRNGLLAGLATVFAMAWTPYFILVVGIAFLTLGVGGIFFAWRGKRLRRLLPTAAIAGGFVLVYLGGFYLLSLQADEGQGLRAHDVTVLNTFSARWYEYVVPHASHPLVGDRTGPWLQERIHGSNASESTLYIGLSILVLALVAFVAAVRRKLAAETRRAVLLLAFMGLVAGWASAPPEGVILGRTVPFPSKLITEISSTWRVYTRLVSDVMLAAALMSAVGLATLLRGRSFRAQTVIVLVAGITVIALEFWPARGGTNPIRTQPVYEVLAKLPAGTVAAYPLTGLDEYGERFDQQWYDKPVINGYEPGSDAELRAIRLDDLNGKDTPERLAALGVRYVVVTKPELRESIRERPALRLVHEDPSGAIYRVNRPTTRPAGAAFLTDGFGPAESGLGGQFHWLEQPSGTIELDGRCTRCSGTLRLAFQSFGRPRRVVIRDPEGRVLLRRTIAVPTQVTFPVRFAEQALLEVATRPGPAPISDVVPGTLDKRALSVGVRVVRLRLEPAGGTGG